MLVDRDYMLKKPSGPSGPKLFLDTRIVPLVVNAAGTMEVALDRAAKRAGVEPSTILAGLAAALSVVLWRLLRRNSARQEA